MKRGFGLLGLAVCLGGQLWAMPVFGAEELGLTTPQTPEATPLVVEASPAVEVTPGQPVQLDPGAPTPAVSQSSTEPAPQLPTPGTMQIEAQNPQTGEKFNINISSDQLTYDPQTQLYTLTGEVYIIIPEKSTEILADQVTFNAKTSDMLAVGHVFIIKGDQVVGTERARFDFEHDESAYLRPRTLMQDLRIKSELAVRSDKLLVLKQGRLIVEAPAISRLSLRFRRRGMRIGQGALYNFYSASRGTALLTGDLSSLVLASGQNTNYNLNDQATEEEAALETQGKPISPNDVVMADFSEGSSTYHFKVKTLTLSKPSKGFDEIIFKRAVLKYKDFPIMWAPSLEFGYIPDKSFLTYLGPDFGYNVDYGGVYAGPGWDTRFRKGWLRFSPMITYGGGQRLESNGDKTPATVPSQFGYGFLGHYRSPGNHSDFGYSGTMREPFLISDQILFGRNQTRLRLGINQYYTNGFFGQERPNYVGEVTDLSQFKPFKSWLLRTYASAGVAKDEFFPTRQRRFFVTPKSANPITTDRIQFQTQLRPTQPLFYLGDYGAVSLIAQTRLSAYGTGDVYGIVQGGPFINLVTGPVFSQVRYLYSQVVGSSPFVFDSYYQGRNNIQTVNSIDLGKNITVGATHSLNLNQDNARNDLLVDQRFFVSLGSKNIRFSLAYDTIQKRSFFGLTLNPQSGQAVMDFDTLNKYEVGQNARNTVMPKITP